MALIERFTALLDQGQDNAMIRFSLGDAYLKAGETENAIKHLRAALEHDATYSAAWKTLGKALVAVGHEDEAIEVYQKGIAVAAASGDLQALKEMQVFLKRLQKH